MYHDEIESEEETHITPIKDPEEIIKLRFAKNNFTNKVYISGDQEIYYPLENPDKMHCFSYLDIDYEEDYNLNPYDPENESVKYSLFNPPPKGYRPYAEPLRPNQRLKKPFRKA